MLRKQTFLCKEYMNILFKILRTFFCRISRSFVLNIEVKKTNSLQKFQYGKLFDDSK